MHKYAKWPLTAHQSQYEAKIYKKLHQKAQIASAFSRSTSIESTNHLLFLWTEPSKESVTLSIESLSSVEWQAFLGSLKSASAFYRKRKFLESAEHTYSSILHILIKALLRVCYENYCTRGVIKTVIHHEAKPSIVSASRPHSECYNSHSVQAYSALLCSTLYCQVFCQKTICSEVHKSIHGRAMVAADRTAEEHTVQQSDAGRP